MTENKTQVLDCFEKKFSSYEEMYDFHKELSDNSVWRKARVSSFSAMPLCTDGDGNIANWDECTPTVNMMEAIGDTAENTKLGLKVELLPVYEGEGLFTEEVLCAEQKTLPLRDTAVRSMYERAKISGLSLEKLSKEKLAVFLDECFKLYPEDESLVLIRNDKITACHSSSYAILPIDQLLETLVSGLSDRFGTVNFANGYTSHSFVTAEFVLKDAQKTLLSRYTDHLKKIGRKQMADNLVPAIKFSSSDTGVSSARCSAYLVGNGAPISIGSALELEHKGKASVAHFGTKVEQLFAQFDKSLARLEKLLDIYVQHPISCMERVCKHLKLPKKASLEAIAQFEIVNGDNPCTAHDIYEAMQEIVFLYRTSDKTVSPSTILNYEENVSRALFIDWDKFDIMKRIEW